MAHQRTCNLAPHKKWWLYWVDNVKWHETRALNLPNLHPLSWINEIHIYISLHFWRKIHSTSSRHHIQCNSLALYDFDAMNPLPPMIDSTKFASHANHVNNHTTQWRISHAKLERQTHGIFITNIKLPFEIAPIFSLQRCSTINNGQPYSNSQNNCTPLTSH